MSIDAIVQQVSSALESMKEHGFSKEDYCLALHPAVCADIPADTLMRSATIPVVPVGSANDYADR